MRDIVIACNTFHVVIRWQWSLLPCYMSEKREYAIAAYFALCRIFRVF